MVNGELLQVDQPLAVTINYSWEPASGTLGVFCQRKDIRQDLAALFQKAVLGTEGEAHEIPMCEFDLSGFATPLMLHQIESQLVDSLTAVTIQKIRLTKAIVQRLPIHLVVAKVRCN